MRRRIPDPAPTSAPPELAVCYVEDWSPEDDPPERWWFSGTTPEERERVIYDHRMIRAHRRWWRARQAYREEHHVTEVWPSSRPQWRNDQRPDPNPKRRP